MTNRLTLLSSTAALVALLAAGSTPAAAQSLDYAFVDVSVVPMDSNRVLEHQSVMVSDGRITAIGTTARLRPPASATVIDGRGRFLVPGLGDAHAHLRSVGGGPTLAERAVMLYALNGVTMARSMYTEPHHRAVRDRIERGEIVGPRPVIVSPALTGQNAPTPEAARTLLRQHQADRYAVLKVLAGPA